MFYYNNIILKCFNTRKSRKIKQLRKEKRLSLEETPFRLTPNWENADINTVLLYIEDPERLRKMRSKKEEILIDIFVQQRSLNSKSAINFVASVIPRY